MAATMPTAGPVEGAPPTRKEWDTDKAVAVLVVGALAFVVAVKRGFRGVL